MASWDISDDDLKRLTELNRVVFDLEKQIKEKLFPIRSGLLNWFKKDEITDFKLETTFGFKLSDGDNFNVSLHVDCWTMPNESELDTFSLASEKNFNPYHGLADHPLKMLECCFVLAKAILLVDVEKRKMLCACEEVIATTAITLDQRGYAVNFNKERFVSIRSEFMQD